MKKVLIELIECVEFHVWSVRLAWRHANQRWFIFRDAPLHVVATFAGWAEDPQLDDDMRSAVRQAVAELKLRLQRLQRDLESGGANAAAIMEGKHRC